MYDADHNEPTDAPVVTPAVAHPAQRVVIDLTVESDEEDRVAAAADEPGAAAEEDVVPAAAVRPVVEVIDLTGSSDEEDDCNVGTPPVVRKRARDDSAEAAEKRARRD